MNSEQIDALNKIIESCFNYGAVYPCFGKECKESIGKFLEVMGAENCEVIEGIGDFPFFRVVEYDNDDEENKITLPLDK